MKANFNVLSEIIDDMNRNLVIEECGSRDAINDPEWAKFEGIDIIDCNTDVLKLMLIKSNHNLDDAIRLLNKCIAKSHNLSIDLVNSINIGV